MPCKAEEEDASFSHFPPFLTVSKQDRCRPRSYRPPPSSFPSLPRRLHRHLLPPQLLIQHSPILLLFLARLRPPPPKPPLRLKQFIRLLVRHDVAVVVLLLTLLREPDRRLPSPSPRPFLPLLLLSNFPQYARFFVSFGCELASVNVGLVNPIGAAPCSWGGQRCFEGRREKKRTHRTSRQRWPRRRTGRCRRQ